MHVHVRITNLMANRFATGLTSTPDHTAGGSPMSRHDQSTCACMYMYMQ